MVLALNRDKLTEENVGMRLLKKILQSIAPFFKIAKQVYSLKVISEVIDVYECEKTGHTRAVIKLSGRHIIEKNICDIITDNHIIEFLDKKSIRALTYLAVVETLKPDYSIVVQQMSEEIENYKFILKSRSKKSCIVKSPSELSRDKSLISKLSAIDANRIGFLAAMQEQVIEEKLVRAQGSLRE